MMETGWMHPVHGRITEYLCEQHNTELLQALNVLQIGCRSWLSNAVHCTRCRPTLTKESTL
jgi:hypothetical protein